MSEGLSDETKLFSRDAWQAKDMNEPSSVAGIKVINQISADPKTVVLCTDFDGTISQIVADPNKAKPYPGSIELLAQLSEKLKGVALVTGRSVKTAVNLTRLENFGHKNNLFALGQYGIERWSSQNWQVESPPIPPTVRQALSDMEKLIDDVAKHKDLKGVTIEDKGRAVSLHTRQTNNPEGLFTFFEPKIKDIAAKYDLVVEPGRNVLEIRAGKHDKGDAIKWLAKYFNPKMIIMIGDDLGDLAAFSAVKQFAANGRIGINIASQSLEQPKLSQQADVILTGPASVTQWLANLVNRLAK